MIYLFDVDGTLTPPRQPMRDSFAEKFSIFLQNNICYVVSGSDIKKLKEQLPQNILEGFKGTFCSMGNEFFIGENCIYSNIIELDNNLLADLENFRSITKYPHKLFPNYIEKRVGMVNFSALGRDCSAEDRDKYYEWDLANKERESIKDYLSNKYPAYDISVGGQISIDITLKGKGKEQAVKYLRDNYYPKEKIVFCGDKINEGGNDYFIAKYCLENDTNAIVIEVKTPEQLLEDLYKK
ncbi:MAG: HAD-IIB family hydrolase [Alphaproteobacteria bacterium]|nr:HAD-IIB family hydrolase [Alphaproteobacteria bacterium]